MGWRQRFGTGGEFLLFFIFHFKKAWSWPFKKVSEQDWLTAWGLGNGVGPVAVAVSAFSRASLSKISLCGWPALLSLPGIS